METNLNKTGSPQNVLVKFSFVRACFGLYFSNIFTENSFYILMKKHCNIFIDTSSVSSHSKSIRSLLLANCLRLVKVTTCSCLNFVCTKQLNVKTSINICSLVFKIASTQVQFRSSSKNGSFFIYNLMIKRS